MDVFSIGDGRFLEQVIQAVTLVSGSGDFASMAKIGVLFGIILVTFQALTSGGRNFNWPQIGIAGLVYALMFGSTQTVTVTDAYTQEVRVVDNVPTGVAATGSFLSGIGFNLTELFETAFSTPTMTTQGYGFSLDVLKRVRMNSLTEFHLGNANSPTQGTDFVESWSQYIATCALPAMELGDITKDVLFRTPDFLSGLAVSDVNREALLRTTPTPQSLPCDVAFETLQGFTEATFLPAFKGQVLPGVLGLLPPANNAAEVEQRINDALNGLGVGPAPQSNFTVNAPPIDADDFIISSVLVPIYYKAARERYVRDGVFSFADQLDDAVRARNSQWMANQSLFDRYLRPMMTFIEGFVFAAAPFLSLLIPIGAIGIGAAGRFILVGAWIQLWMPALAIVNLFLHDVVAGKMAALADAGTPLTSLAGLQQGDDIIQTWLATGGLMASAVPVLTLMLVYGGAISANFFATRLQGEDVVMERQAAGSTFTPFSQMHVDPASTFNRTQGVSMQTGAEGRLDTFSYSARAGAMFESASDARMQAVDQFSSDFRQSMSNAWSDQTTASVMQGYSERLAAEGGAVESAMNQHFGDTMRDLSAQTGMTNREAMNFTLGAALQGSLGTSESLYSSSESAGALGGSGRGNIGLSSQESREYSAGQSEQLRAQISDKIAENEEVRASLMEAVAADIQGNTQDAMISSESLGSDEALSASAQDAVSASQSYSESISAGASMEASRSVSAATMIPAIAANQEAVNELDDLVARHGLAGQVQTYENFHGERDTQSFDGNAELAHIYAQAHVASQHVANGEQDSAAVQAGLADVFDTAEGGFGRSMGDATGHSDIFDNAPSFGGTAAEVGSGMAAGPAGLDGFEDRMAETRASIDDHMTGVPSAHQGFSGKVEEQERTNLNEQNERVLATQRAHDRVPDAVNTEVLNAPRDAVDSISDAIETAVGSIRDMLPGGDGAEKKSSD